jgi:hypothetical protein
MIGQPVPPARRSLERLMPEENPLLRTLVYRYFFYGWLFRDVQRGNIWERRAAWDHNRHQARWLPTYMRRWALCAGTLFVLALVAELGLESVALSVCLYLPSVMAIPFLAVTWVAWRFLVRGDWGYPAT